MNSNTLIRFFNKTTTFYTRRDHVSRILQHFSCNKMFSSVSIPYNLKDKETFENVLPGVINSIVTSSKFSEVPDLGNWIKQVLYYNLAGGKKFRGLTTVYAYEMLEKPENVTEETLKLARILGWCVEMLQAYLIVLDDIMDGSTTRRGNPCWYRTPGVGLGALNDSIFIQTSIFEIIKTYFSGRPEYNNLTNVFNEALFYTAMGQHLDITTARQNNNDYKLFTMERYLAICKYKTAYYTYNLPVCLGLYLASKTDEHAYKTAEEICLEIGTFFQIQDDFIDCFSDESLSGKAGTDIQEGKCTWLAVNALQRCTPTQRNVFAACYGSHEPAHVERVKRLYEQLELPQLYAKQEKERYDRIIQRLQTLPDTLPPTLFLKLIDMIYKRKH